MACEYYSRVEVGTFTNGKILEKALARLNRRDYKVSGLNVEATDRAKMNELRQAYATEAAKAALKAKGYAVAEKKDRNSGKIRLTVQA
jgi:hypothetical protein